MEKKPFVTKEKIEEIVQKYPTPFIYMMKKVFVKMQLKLNRHLHGIRDSRNSLLLRRHRTHFLSIS